MGIIIIIRSFFVVNYRFVLVLVVLFALLTVLPASAALYDQMGNKHWCNSDSYGCWISGENGAHEYIMFWSEDARAAIMGPDSDAPLGITLPGESEMPLQPPATALPASTPERSTPIPHEISPTPDAPMNTPAPSPTPPRDYSAEKNACVIRVECDCVSFPWGGYTCSENMLWDDVKHKCYCANKWIN